MTTFLCYRPDYGHTIDDATKVDAFDSETAAELYVERRFSDWEFPIESTVHVVSTEDTQVTEAFDVLVESVPVFHAYKRTASHPTPEPKEPKP